MQVYHPYSCGSAGCKKNFGTGQGRFNEAGEISKRDLILIKNHAVATMGDLLTPEQRKGAVRLKSQYAAILLSAK